MRDARYEIERELKRAEARASEIMEEWRKGNEQSRYAIGYRDGLRFALEAMKDKEEQMKLF